MDCRRARNQTNNELQTPATVRIGNSSPNDAGYTGNAPQGKQKQHGRQANEKPA